MADQRYKTRFPFRPEHIVCTAVYYDDGITHVHQPCNINTGYVITGYRHCNCFATASILRGDAPRVIETSQGFLTSQNRYVDRQEAAMIAVHSKQIGLALPGYELFSEDIY